MKLRHVFAVVFAAVVVLLLSPAPARAGDIPLGRVTATDAGSAHNQLTGTTFPIALGTLLSVQCDSTALFQVGVTATDAGNGIKLAADALFQTSCPSSQPVVSLADGGTYAGCTVAVAPFTGSANSSCLINSVKGNE